jgi:hypothetical protein
MSYNMGNGPEGSSNPKADAKAAKAYAKASRPWYKKKRWWLVAVFIVIIGASAAGGGADETPTAVDNSSSQSNETGKKDEAAAEEKAEPTKEPEPTKEAKPEAMPVKAAAILKEFEDNELSADAKYKGKTLKVTGVVDKIDTDLFDDEKYILRLADGGDFAFLTVNCYDMSTDELATLNKGDNATVIGEFDDGGDLGVEVNDCKLA